MVIANVPSFFAVASGEVKLVNRVAVEINPISVDYRVGRRFSPFRCHVKLKKQGPSRFTALYNRTMAPWYAAA